MSLLSTMIRIVFKHSDYKSDRGLTTPEDVMRFDDICYGPDEKWNVLDVYRPKDREGPLPVIVSVHGGGWIYGDKELYQYYCMSLAQHGFAVVNFTYRLAPKHKYPSFMEDTVNVFRWVQDNSDKYGFDRDNVFAVGDSAGANMLGLLCCLCINREYAATMPFAIPEGIKPKAVALNCGLYRIDASEKGLTSKLMRDVLPEKGTPEECRSISVTEHVNGDFPPAFVMTAEGDFLSGEAMPFVELLKKHGAKAEYHYYGDKEHVLGHVFHCNTRLPEARQCNKDECDFFRSLM